MKEFVQSVQDDMFYVASTCVESVLDFPSIFDVCYMIDKKSILVSSRVPVSIMNVIYFRKNSFRNLIW